MLRTQKRYIKALEELKKLRKSQADDAKTERRILESKEELRRQSAQLRARHEQNRAAIQETEGRIAAQREKLQAREAENAERAAALAALTAKQTELDTKRAQVAPSATHVQRLLASLEHVFEGEDFCERRLADALLSESDDKLRELMDAYRRQELEQQRQTDDFDREKAAIDGEVAELQRALDTATRDRINCQAAKEVRLD